MLQINGFQQAVRYSSTDSKDGKVDENAKVEETVETGPEVDDFGDVVPKINHEEKILTLEKDIRDLKDRVMRSLAEEENVRHFI